MFASALLLKVLKVITYGLTVVLQGDVTLYNLDPATTLEQLYQSFVSFGDVKDIVATASRSSGATRIIQFYDGRAHSNSFLPPSLPPSGSRDQQSSRLILSRNARHRRGTYRHTPVWW